jgi:peptidoglycan hydrolase-like protein with peptidoglycan-binding domain
MRNLTVGSAGEDVKNLQGLLNFHLAGKGMPRLVRDGTFGPKTRAAVIRFQGLNGLAADGVVGYNTRAALLDAREATMMVGVGPANGNQQGQSANSLANVMATAKMRTKVQLPVAITAPALRFGGPVTQQFQPVQQAQPAPTPTSTVTAQSVTIQVGQQVNFNPWFISPFVISGQWNILIQNQGRAPFQISPGLQFFQNQIGSPSGKWSGQGFLQMGPTGLFKAGNFDLLNPFVQAFVQKNDGQNVSTGFAVGNQANWNILGDRLSLFVNVQEVFAVDGGTGLGIAPSTQIFGGVGVDLFQLFKTR